MNPRNKEKLIMFGIMILVVIIFIFMTFEGIKQTDQAIYDNTYTDSLKFEQSIEDSLKNSISITCIRDQFNINKNERS